MEKIMGPLPYDEYTERILAAVQDVAGHLRTLQDAAMMHDVERNDLIRALREIDEYELVRGYK
jgi:hypothetical protein